jgi:hypothetical protein
MKRALTESDARCWCNCLSAWLHDGVNPISISGVEVGKPVDPRLVHVVSSQLLLPASAIEVRPIMGWVGCARPKHEALQACQEHTRKRHSSRVEEEQTYHLAFSRSLSAKKDMFSSFGKSNLNDLSTP